MITEIEKVENLFRASRIKTISMHRINFLNKRLYVDDQSIYSGLTGALSAATPKGDVESKRIDKWRNGMINHLGSIDKQESLLNSMADFGTLVHTAALVAWEMGEMNWKNDAEYAREFFIASAKKNNIEVNENVLQSQIFEYQKSVASIMQFLFDEVEELYAVESPAKCDALMIATPIDLVVKLKNGNIACLNIKTSAKIGRHQLEQAAMEMYLWNNTYKDVCEAQLTGILRPKDWSMKKGQPTYELVLLKPQEQIEMQTKLFRRLLEIKDDVHCTYLNYPRNVNVFVGTTKLGEQPKIEARNIIDYLNQNIYETAL